MSPASAAPAAPGTIHMHSKTVSLLQAPVLLFFSDFFHGSTDLVGLGLLIVEVSSSHSDTPQSLGLLCTSDRLGAETSI